MSWRSTFAFLRREWTAAIPALLVVLGFGGFWLWLYEQRLSRAQLVHAYVGWMGLMLLIGTLSVIIWAARAGSKGSQRFFGGEGRRAFLGFALVGDASGLLAVGVGLLCGLFQWRSAIQLYLVLASWMGMWSGMVWLLRRWGPGVGEGVGLALAMILMAGPVSLMPLARMPWASQEAMNQWQPRVAEGIGIGCPMLGALDAMNPDLRLDWPQLPQMYRLSGLGQEIPMELPKWWINTAVYAGVGIVAATLGGRWRRT